MSLDPAFEKHKGSVQFVKGKMYTTGRKGHAGGIFSHFSELFRATLIK